MIHQPLVFQFIIIILYYYHFLVNSNFLILFTGAILIASLVVKQYYLNSENSRLVTDAFCDTYNNRRCENGGLLEYTGNGFVCKCTINYYGENCTNVRFWMQFKWITRVLDSTDMDVDRGQPGMWWSILPFTSNLQLKTLYSFHQNQLKRLDMFSDNNNHHTKSLKVNNMTSTRILPPYRPLRCLADNRLPSITMLYKQIFERKHDQFKPDPKRRNLLFYTFYQYFVLQFFDTNFNLTVTASQLYGADEVTKIALRSLSNGKLKTEFLNNEHYPPYMSSAKSVKMVYPPMEKILNSHWFNRVTMYSRTYKYPKYKWAMGHPLLSMNPLLFIMSTIWIREHNRVCDVLIKKWPTWTDDQTYNTAKRIIIGEMMQIMMKEIIIVHTGHKYSLDHKPEIFHSKLQNINSRSTPFELLLTTMWPSALPNEFNKVPMNMMMFGNNEQVYTDNITNTIKLMVNQKMGMVTHNNDGAATEPLTKLMMKLSREHGLQSFNNYRRQLGLNPYRSFYKLTRNLETAETLKTLYNNVEDIELITGMMTERKSDEFVSTAIVMTNSFIINSILTNYLTSKEMWVPDTFGGNEGFSMVKTAHIQNLVCNNLAENCNSFLVKLYAEEEY